MTILCADEAAFVAQIVHSVVCAAPVAPDTVVIRIGTGTDTGAAGSVKI